LPVRRPRTKGKVERTIFYLQDNFLDQVLEQQIEITPELAQQIEKANPAFAERWCPRHRPD
jgi:hypothetical protein